MKPFREIHAKDLHSFPLKDEMSSLGCLLVRDVVPRSDVARVCAEIVEVISTPRAGCCPATARWTAWQTPKPHVATGIRHLGRSKIRSTSWNRFTHSFIIPRCGT